MIYVVMISQILAIILIIMTMVLDAVSERKQNELRETYQIMIENYQKGYEELYRKYKKLLDFKYNIRLILLKSDAQKENYFKTIEQIKNELDNSLKSI